MLVAAPAAPAPGHGHLLSRPRQVGQPLAALFVDYRGPDGNRQKHVPARMPGAVGAFSMPSAVSPEFAVEAIAQQRIVVLRSLQNHATTRAAVAPRRPAAWHEFLPAKGHAAVAAVPCLDIDFRFIDKHVLCLFRPLKSIRH